MQVLEYLKPEARKRALEFIRLVQRAEVLARQYPAAWQRKRSAVTAETRQREELEARELKKIVSKLDSIYRTMQVRPKLFHDLDRGRLRFIIEPRYRSVDESVAYFYIGQAANSGVIGRMKECSYCGKSFFAKFPHQTHCVPEHQIAENSESEKWKAYRRNKAKQYYWERKEGLRR